MTEVTHHTPEEIAEQVRQLAGQLQMAGRKDLLLKAIGAPLLEELRIEAARAKLSRLLITRDYRFVLLDYEQKEVELQPLSCFSISKHLGAEISSRFTPPNDPARS